MHVCLRTQLSSAVSHAEREWKRWGRVSTRQASCSVGGSPHGRRVKTGEASRRACVPNPRLSQQVCLKSSRVQRQGLCVLPLTALRTLLTPRLRTRMFLIHVVLPVWGSAPPHPPAPPRAFPGPTTHLAVPIRASFSFLAVRSKAQQTRASLSLPHLRPVLL